MYDITGKHLLKGTFDDNNNQINLPANTAQGTYLLYFKVDDGTTEVKKWLVE